MTSDDDSFLTAYMDGQLDGDQQRRVEANLIANPQLAEQLRGLTVLRDLVAGLAHDATVNVVPEVMEQIRGRSLGHGELRHSTRGRLVHGGMPQ